MQKILCYYSINFWKNLGKINDLSNTVTNKSTLGYEINDTKTVLPPKPFYVKTYFCAKIFLFLVDFYGHCKK